MIHDTWKHGNIDVRPVNNARIRYVLNYINQDPIFPDSKFEMYGDYEPPFYHFSKGLGFEEIFKLYENGEVNQFGEIYFNDSGHKYILPQYLKTKLDLSSKHNLYPDSVIDWSEKKGIKNIEDALDNRSKVVERCNIQSAVARGKLKQDYKQAELNIAEDRLNRFKGFTDYSDLDKQIGLIIYNGDFPES